VLENAPDFGQWISFDDSTNNSSNSNPPNDSPPQPQVTYLLYLLVFPQFLNGSFIGNHITVARRKVVDGVPDEYADFYTAGTPSVGSGAIPGLPLKARQYHVRAEAGFAQAQMVVGGKTISESQYNKLGFTFQRLQTALEENYVPYGVNVIGLSSYLVTSNSFAYTLLKHSGLGSSSGTDPHYAPGWGVDLLSIYPDL
jgi:hypothetical protein